MLTHIQVHDPAISGPCFVLGTGQFVDPGDICFNVWFAPSNLPNDRRMENMRRKLLERHQRIANGTLQPYHSINEVRGMLTFTSAFQIRNCHAFAPLPRLEVPPYRKKASFLHIRKTPHWNFNPRVRQASPKNLGALELKRLIFEDRYDRKFGSDDFYQAAFCLAGLVRADCITFNYDALGNRITALGDWGVDDFIVRWRKYEKFVAKFSLAQCPSPAIWMIARLAQEARNKRQMKPWRGRIGACPLTEPVIDWDFLQSIEWNLGPRKTWWYPQTYSCQVCFSWKSYMDFANPDL